MRRLFTLILLASLTTVFGLAPARRVPTAVRASTAADKSYAVIVKMAAGASITAIKTKYNLTLLTYSPVDNRYLLQPPAGTDLNQLASAIATASGVLGAEVNAEIDSPFISQGQPHNFQGGTPIILGSSSAPYASQTLISFFQLNSVQSISRGQNVKVAVIDTGIDLLHPIFSGHIASGGYDFLDNDLLPNEECCGVSYGHGTFVAGLVLLMAPDAQILPIRILDPNGMGNVFDVSAAIRYAANQGAKVINLSLGTDTQRPNAIHDALVYAQGKGCVIIASAGNYNDGSGEMFPANEGGNVLGSGATNFYYNKAAFSNYGGCVELCAPGIDLISAYPGGLFAQWSGTSFSAPLMSAEAALLFAKKPRSAADVITVMNGTAIKIDTSALNPTLGGKLGHGLISPLAALKK